MLPKETGICLPVMSCLCLYCPLVMMCPTICFCTATMSPCRAGTHAPSNSSVRVHSSSYVQSFQRISVRSLTLPAAGVHSFDRLSIVSIPCAVLLIFPPIFTASSLPVARGPHPSPHPAPLRPSMPGHLPAGLSHSPMRPSPLSHAAAAAAAAPAAPPSSLAPALGLAFNGMTRSSSWVAPGEGAEGGRTR